MKRYFIGIMLVALTVARSDGLMKDAMWDALDALRAVFTAK